MSNCEKCNAELNEGSKFCPNCGAMVKATVFCPNCGEKTNKEFDFCQRCGENMYENVAAPIQPTFQTTDAGINSKLMKKNKLSIKKLPIKIIAIILVAAIVITAVVITAVLIINPFASKEKLSIAYLKDNEIDFTFLNKIKPLEFTSKLMDSTIATNNTVTSEDLAPYVKYSDDGKYMFYPDKISESDVSLYFRNLNTDNSKTDAAIKIDSEINIRTYMISKNGTKVFYTKSTDNNLYLHNLKDKEKIDTLVDKFFINEDGSTIIYEKETAIYLYSVGSKEKVKIDSNAVIKGISKDLNKIYYTKEGSLYLKEANKDKQKISSDVDSLVARYDNGSLYYIKSSETQTTLSNYVNDDLLTSDAAITQPNITAYQTTTTNSWGYPSTVTDYTAYNAATAKYTAKVARDTLRKSLSTEKITDTNKTLYYYDGTKETAISDSINITNTFSEVKPIVLYSKYNKSEVTKAKISEIKTTSEVKSLITAAQTSSSETYIAINEKETVIDQTNAAQFELNYSSNKLYFIDDYSTENDYGTLMEANITADTISSPTKVDDDVAMFRFRTDSDSMIYFKDVKTGTGDIYENNKSIASDVLIGSVHSFKNSSVLVYFTDFSSTSLTGTLNILNGTKAKKIADDVSAFSAINEKNTAYITNYDKVKNKGDAYLFNGSSKAVKIDTDVTGFISKSSNDSIYGYYNNYSGMTN